MGVGSVLREPHFFLRVAQVAVGICIFSALAQFCGYGLANLVIWCGVSTETLGLVLIASYALRLGWMRGAPSLALDGAWWAQWVVAASLMVAQLVQWPALNDVEAECAAMAAAGDPCAFSSRRELNTWAAACGLSWVQCILFFASFVLDWRDLVQHRRRQRGGGDGGGGSGEGDAAEPAPDADAAAAAGGKAASGPDGQAAAPVLLEAAVN